MTNPKTSMESRFDKEFCFSMPKNFNVGDVTLNEPPEYELCLKFPVKPEKIKAFIRKELKANDKKWQSLIDKLKVTEPPKDVEKLKEKRQAFMAGQMNIILKLKMSVNKLLQEKV